MQHFNNPFTSPRQEYFGSASQLAVQLDGTGEPNISGWYSCKCPAHGDERASLSLKDTPYGLIAKCFAGCKPAEIKAALSSLKAAGALSKPYAAQDGKVEQLKLDLLQSAANIWHASGPNTDPLLQRYKCEHRRINITLSDAVRFHPSLFHKESGTCGPAMVAVVQDVHGDMCGIHRTWLDPVTGGKAKLDPVRKALCPTAGRSVHLGEPEATLFVAEGIETALSVQELNDGVPVWAALSAPGIASLIIPDRVQKVIVACDNDKAGIDAANYLAGRLSRLDPPVLVERILPPQPHKDFNDWLKAVRA